MDKEARNIFEMTNEEASIIIGNIPVYPIYPGDDYSVAEYQWAKSMAIKALLDDISCVESGDEK